MRVEKLAAGSSVEVKSPKSNTTVMKLPLSSLNNLAKLVETIGRYLSANASARQLLQNDSVAAPDPQGTVVQENG